MLMEELTAIIEELEALESELQFEHFNSDDAMRSGAFPIRLKNCSTAIGTIIVSGFEHTMDHEIIIDVLRSLDI